MVCIYVSEKKKQPIASSNSASRPPVGTKQKKKHEIIGVSVGACRGQSINIMLYLGSVQLDVEGLHLFLDGVNEGVDFRSRVVEEPALLYD